MKKYVNKKQRIQSHHLFMLIASLADALDEIPEMNLSTKAKEIKTKSEELKVLLDAEIDNIFGKSTKIRSNTYVQEIQEKIKSVIRNNYQEM